MFTYLIKYNLYSVYTLILKINFRKVAIMTKGLVSSTTSALPQPEPDLGEYLEDLSPDL